MFEIYEWNALSAEEQFAILQRPQLTNNYTIQAKVSDILAYVKTEGDQALLGLTEKFDGIRLPYLCINAQEIQKAASTITAEEKQAIIFAAKQIEKFHLQQVEHDIQFSTVPGINFLRRFTPINKVGLYIPGGSAPLISTLLMLSIPARIAGCALKVLTTPPNRLGKIDPRILFAADICGIDKVYSIGGAQAIAAMAYGTETIPKVDKIFGPGNAWVTMAKQCIQADPEGAAIDMPAGPSEVLVIADESANPNIVAADLLAQAEHGDDSQVILITTNKVIAERTLAALANYIPRLPRCNTLQTSLKLARFILVNTISEGITLSNQYAPEHLILNVLNPEHYINDIQHAGTVFLGPWAAETLGDYVSGSNHVLPTYGWAKCYSGLGLKDFGKTMTFQKVNLDGLRLSGPHAITLAKAEALDAHALAVELRLDLAESTT